MRMRKKCEIYKHSTIHVVFNERLENQAHLLSDDALEHTAFARALSSNDTNLRQFEIKAELTAERRVLQAVDRLNQLTH